MKTSKKFLCYLVFPIVLVWKVLKWPSKLFKIPKRKNDIEKIADLIPEGTLIREDDNKLVYDRNPYTFRNTLEYAKYKEHNPDNLIRIKSWSFGPIVYSTGDVRYTKKIINRWRWRLGLYTSEEAENKNID